MIMMNAGESDWLCEAVRCFFAGRISYAWETPISSSLRMGPNQVQNCFTHDDVAQRSSPVFPLTDTYAVGAGDAFTAGFHGWISGRGRLYWNAPDAALPWQLFRFIEARCSEWPT